MAAPGAGNGIRRPGRGWGRPALGAAGKDDRNLLRSPVLPEPANAGIMGKSGPANTGRERIGHGEGRESKAEDALSGEDLPGGDGRRAPAHPAGDRRPVGGLRRERGPQDPLPGLRGAAPLRPGHHQRAAGPQHLLSPGRAGIRAAGAQAAGGLGAVLPLHHGPEIPRADPQAGGPGQRPSGPAAAPAGAHQRAGQDPERKHLLQRGHPPRGHQFRRADPLSIFPVERAQGDGAAPPGSLVSGEPLVPDLGRRELLSGGLRGRGRQDQALPGGQDAPHRAGRRAPGRRRAICRLRHGPLHQEPLRHVRRRGDGGHFGGGQRPGGHHHRPIRSGRLDPPRGRGPLRGPGGGGHQPAVLRLGDGPGQGRAHHRAHARGAQDAPGGAAAERAVPERRGLRPLQARERDTKPLSSVSMLEAGGRGFVCAFIFRSAIAPPEWP